ncbi:hypothetical protein GCM10028822_11090 [Hymenobacter terrigena]
MIDSTRRWKRRPAAWLAAGFLSFVFALCAYPGQAAPGPTPRILKLYNTADPKQDSVFALEAYITLEVAGLARYMRDEEARLMRGQMDPGKARAQARRLVLYIDDAPLIGMPPESMHTLPPVNNARPAAPLDSGRVAVPAADTLTKVIFHLTRHQSTNPYWNVVYSSPWEFAHPAKIGLGYDDRVITNLYPQESIRLKLVRPVALAVALAVVALLALAIVLLAHKSWLLRNAVPNWTSPAGKEPMFSLAKSQLAWWTFLVLASYLLIYCVTGEMTNISTTTLELLGISAGTAGLGSLLGQPAANALAPPPPPSRGWWLDMLTDDQGVSIHRLQQVAFTLLLGYLFVRTVYKTVALPEWNENEILLLGISSATYLGLKSQENKTPENQLVTADATSFGPLAKDAGLTVSTVAAEAPAVVGTVNRNGATAAPSAEAASDIPAESSADPVTGAVQFRAEEDMGPDAPANDLDNLDPTESPNQIPG